MPLRASLLLGKFAISRYGASTGYEILIVGYAALLVTPRLIPQFYTPIVRAGASRMPSLPGLLALLIVISYLTE